MPDWAIWIEAVLHGAPFTIILAMIVFLIVHHNDSDAQVVNDPYVIVRDIAEQQQEMARQMQAMTNHIERLSTPALTDDTPHMDTTTDDPARAYLDSLTAQYGSLTKAAKAMGVKRQTLYNRANKLKEE
jgi:transcriptional regulator with PAS, ATPase and Fis domain